ncbi:hypothetical protein DAERI_110087 [Deinococcus aerius]|uniref:Lipoprotein n=1 Tax=Deinococcus aerius TaxID=200253 RepID=A0A2I9E0D3_9DEIO|nr:hypothetical protein [Deinococcus aerius]GBF06905.1 hypothetical protein DAERI_110087 [Deinococcus aerius]
MSRPRLMALALLLPGLLAACTGTDEGAVTLRLAVLTDGGATVRTVTTSSGGTTPAPGDVTVSVNGGVTLDTLPGGARLALTLAGGVESRDVNLANAAPFAALPFTPTCLTATALSAARDRLLTLNQCGTGGTVNGPQQLALYRTDGTLVWTATLPTFTPPIATPDTPPLRIAVIGNTGVVARPVVGGGSETIRVAPQNTGDIVATSSTPVRTVAIRDLAPSGSLIYAATDAGVQPLRDTGEPDPSRTVTAFGTGRVDRLWTSAGSGSVGNLFAAWRDATLGGDGSSQPLRLWDGARTSAVTVTFFSALRDVTFAPDGNLYALTRTDLRRYDTVFGLSQNNWREQVLLSGLNDARAVTWLVP